MSLETALALLQTAASEIEEESDQVAKQFLCNEVELDDFLEDFLKKRILMHTRLVKAEKMAKILSSDPVLNNIPNYVNAPPVSINSNYFPGINPNPNSVPEQKIEGGKMRNSRKKSRKPRQRNTRKHMGGQATAVIVPPTY